MDRAEPGMASSNSQSRLEMRRLRTPSIAASILNDPPEKRRLPFRFRKLEAVSAYQVPSQYVIRSPANPNLPPSHSLGICRCQFKCDRKHHAAEGVIRIRTAFDNLNSTCSAVQSE